MASKYALLAAASLMAVGWVADVQAEEPRPPQDPLEKPASASTLPPPSPGGKSRQAEKMRRAFRDGPEAEKTREALRNMSPEERERWTKRFREWADLPPEKKKALQDREENFRRRMREDIETAIKTTNLTLNDEEKKQFSKRYAEERRKLEEELRREMEEIRRPKVQALIEKLKGEFSTPAPAPTQPQ